MDLIHRLRQLAAEGATGRLDVTGSPGGRIYVAAGAIAGAEQHGRPTLLAAMAEKKLFAPAEWVVARKAEPGRRWQALAAGDAARLEHLVAFAEAFTSQQLHLLVAGTATSAAFVEDAQPSLGILRAWSLDDLIGSEFEVNGSSSTR